MTDNFLHESIYQDYLELLLWNWGHGRGNKVPAIRDEITKLCTEFGKPVFCRENIESSLNSIEGTAKEISELTSPFQIEPVSVNSLVEERVKILEKMQSYLGVLFTMNLVFDSPIVQANKIWLRCLLDIVIDNVIKAMEVKFENEINIATFWQEQEVCIAVHGTGEEINK